jgi:hypothetical protein
VLGELLENQTQMDSLKNTPVKTPVNIVNQPYLAGQRDGIVYLVQA